MKRIILFATVIWFCSGLFSGVEARQRNRRLSPQTGTSKPPEQKKDKKDEVLRVTLPPECKYEFKVFVPKEGEAVSEGGILLLESLGTGVAGLAEGSGLKVTCGDTTGSGWIDKAGELQSFIAPEQGWLSERSTGGWKTVDGELHVITEKLPFEGGEVEGTYARFVGAPLSQHTVRLLKRIGIGIGGVASKVKVRLTDGRVRRGTLTADGVVAITSESWPDYRRSLSDP